MNPQQSAIETLAYHRLAAAVLANAAKQASQGDLDALVWMVLEGPKWLRELGFDGQAVRGWITGSLEVPGSRYWGE